MGGSSARSRRSRLQVFSQNARGLTSEEKLEEFYNAMHERRFYAGFVQETWRSDVREVLEKDRGDGSVLVTVGKERSQQEACCQACKCDTNTPVIRGANSIPQYVATEVK